MKYDTDFVPCEPCTGRAWMTPLERWWSDLCCRWTGHMIWRTGGQRENPTGSLPLNAVYCRRCLKGGYVMSDYYQNVRQEIINAVRACARS